MKIILTNFQLQILITFLGILFMTSCTPPEEKPVDYFPLVHGAVYEYNDGVSRREVVFYDKKNSYDLFEIKIFSDDSLYIMKDQFIRSANRIYWYGFKSADFGKIYFEPPINLIPQIFDKDTTFSVSVREIHDADTENRIYNLRVSYRFMGKKNITVPAGVFDAIHYRYYIRYIGQPPEEALMDFSGDWWFAKDVGLVKQTSAHTTLELSNYDIP